MAGTPKRSKERQLPTVREREPKTSLPSKGDVKLDNLAQNDFEPATPDVDPSRT